MDVRIINQNLSFQNDTGLNSFNGNEAELIWRTSSQVNNAEGVGLRIYNGENGLIGFEPIQ
jgi:hypothetical protein